MTRCLEVLRSVLVLGRVAASHMTALQAGAQVHPLIAHRDALLADVHFGRNVMAVFQVLAVRHGSP